MTGKTLRATLLSAALLLTATGMTLLNAPTADGHSGHVVGAVLISVGVAAAYVREIVKEDQAKAAIQLIEKAGIIL